jgi:hypothetical protein
MDVHSDAARHIGAGEFDCGDVGGQHPPFVRGELPPIPNSNGKRTISGLWLAARKKKPTGYKPVGFM